MAIEYTTSNTKAELLAIAEANGVAADDSMTKAQITAALDAAGAQDGAEQLMTASYTTEDENATQDSTAADIEGYNSFAYVGPSISNGRLKESAIFRGEIKDVLSYLADVLEDYPQVAKLIVPTHNLAVYSARAKTPGNVTHKYYNDIVSAMRGNKEV